MTSTIFQELIEQELSILKEMVSQIDSKKEGHLKGTALELRIRNMLGKLIPSYCCVSNGWIIDENGRKSDERDILVYNKDKAPQFLFDIGTGIFPLDSIEYDIQIKNCITEKTLQQAFEKFDERINRNVVLGIRGTNLFEKYSKIDSNYLTCPKICALSSEEDKYYFFNVEKIKYKKILNLENLRFENGNRLNINGWDNSNIFINGHNLSDIGDKEITIYRWFSTDIKPKSNLLGFINGFINTLFKVKTGKYFYNFASEYIKCLSFVIFDADKQQIYKAPSKLLNSAFSFNANAKFLENGDINIDINIIEKCDDIKTSNNSKEII